MTTDDKIKDQKLQHDLTREAANLSALSSGKLDKYKQLKGEEILPFNKRQIIQKAKFAYYPLGKAFEKQTGKEVDAIESLDLCNKKDESDGLNAEKLIICFLWDINEGYSSLENIYH